MIGLIGRSLVVRTFEAVGGVLGLPLSRLLIAMTTLVACFAVYSRRIAIAIMMIMLTGLISLAAFLVHALSDPASPAGERPVNQPISQQVPGPPGQRG